MSSESVKLKIALFAGSPINNVGGGEKDALAVAKLLSNVVIFSPENREKKYIYDGVNIIAFKSHSIRLLKDQISFSKLRLNNEFEVVYVMSQGFLLNRKILKKCLKLRIKYIQGIHSPSALALKPNENLKWKIFLHFFYRIFRDSFLKKIPNFRVQNDDDFSRLIELNPKSKIFQFPPYVFDPPVRTKYNNTFTVLWVGRLQRKQKGLDILRYILINANNEIEFHVVGDGPDRGILEDIKRDNVKFLGSINEEELRKEFGNADLFLSTSTAENFGISVAEACVSGLAIVSMPVMGIREILEPHPYKEIGLIKVFSNINDQALEYIRAIDKFYAIRDKLELNRSEISRLYQSKYNNCELKRQWINMVEQSQVSLPA